jgi:hypothetical protein
LRHLEMLLGHEPTALLYADMVLGDSPNENYRKEVHGSAYGKCGRLTNVVPSYGWWLIIIARQQIDWRR